MLPLLCTLLRFVSKTPLNHFNSTFLDWISLTSPLDLLFWKPSQFPFLIICGPKKKRTGGKGKNPSVRSYPQSSYPHNIARISHLPLIPCLGDPHTAPRHPTLLRNTGGIFRSRWWTPRRSQRSINTRGEMMFTYICRSKR